MNEKEPDNTSDRGDSEQQVIPHPWPHLSQVFEVASSKKKKNNSKIKSERFALH